MTADLNVSRRLVRSKLAPSEYSTPDRAHRQAGLERLHEFVAFGRDRLLSWLTPHDSLPYTSAHLPNFYAADSQIGQRERVRTSNVWRASVR